MNPIRIAILGYGKIAEDQHVPSIRGNDRFELVATSSRSGQGVAHAFADWRDLIRSVEGLEAVAITTPPGPRYAIARLYSIAVAPHMSGRGIGPQLLAAAERAAARRGRRVMRLEVHDHNTRAISRYEKSGFRQFGRYRDYYDDHGDALRFEKPL